MDHSLRGYLHRRTTNELEAALQYYLHRDLYRRHELEIREILTALQERYESPTGELPAHIQAAWELYLERIREMAKPQEISPMES